MNRETQKRWSGDRRAAGIRVDSDVESLQFFFGGPVLFRCWTWHSSLNHTRDYVLFQLSCLG
jgi:hypothetical protein